MLTAVAGWPVQHSRSPAMHNAAFRALGLHGWLYVRLPLSPGLFTDAVRALPASGYRGINVTIPHKEAALALADTASPAARSIGAANTLTFGDGVEADNTDAQGFLDALGEPVAGGRALILGAGGAARAVAWALREAGVQEVSLWNRTRERAEALAADLDVRVVSNPESAELLVNATAVGLSGGIDDLPLDQLRDPPAVVADLVYGDDPPPVTAWALARGARVVDGREILVRQGALSFRRWTGQDAPLDVMRGAVLTDGRPLPIRVRLG